MMQERHFLPSWTLTRDSERHSELLKMVLTRLTSSSFKTNTSNLDVAALVEVMN